LTVRVIPSRGHGENVAAAADDHSLTKLAAEGNRVCLRVFVEMRNYRLAPAAYAQTTLLNQYTWQGANVIGVYRDRAPGLGNLSLLLKSTIQACGY
jgi:hypothetical protein